GRGAGDAARLDDQPRADVHQPGVDGDAAQARDAAEDQVAQLSQPAQLAAGGAVPLDDALQLQLGDDAGELGGLDEVEARPEAGQDLLGDGAAGLRQADVAAHLEVGHAQALAAQLEGQGVVGNLLPDGEGVPGLAGVLQGGEGVLEVGGVAAQL